MAFASSNQGSSTAMASPPLRLAMPLLVLPAKERTAPACFRDANGACQTRTTAVGGRFDMRTEAAVVVLAVSRSE